MENLIKEQVNQSFNSITSQAEAVIGRAIPKEFRSMCLFFFNAGFSKGVKVTKEVFQNEN